VDRAPVAREPWFASAGSVIAPVGLGSAAQCLPTCSSPRGSAS
jgi:hypothetical protein